MSYRENANEPDEVTKLRDRVENLVRENVSKEKAAADFIEEMKKNSGDRLCLVSSFTEEKVIL